MCNHTAAAVGSLPQPRQSCPDESLASVQSSSLPQSRLTLALPTWGVQRQTHDDLNRAHDSNVLSVASDREEKKMDGDDHDPSGDGGGAQSEARSLDPFVKGVRGVKQVPDEFLLVGVRVRRPAAAALAVASQK